MQDFKLSLSEVRFYMCIRCVAVVFVVSRVTFCVKLDRKLGLHLEIIHRNTFFHPTPFQSRLSWLWWTWSMVECSFWNPNWLSGIKCLSSISDFRHLRALHAREKWYWSIRGSSFWWITWFHVYLFPFRWNITAYNYFVCICEKNNSSI